MVSWLPYSSAACKVNLRDRSAETLVWAFHSEAELVSRYNMKG